MENGKPKPLLTLDEFIRQTGGWTRMAKAYASLGGDIDSLSPPVRDWLLDKVAAERDEAPAETTTKPPAAR